MGKRKQHKATPCPICNNPEAFRCPTCGGRLEIVVTPLRRLLRRDKLRHKGICHKCKLTVPLDY